MASIVLIFSHPSLGHPEATVRTCFAGQSHNLWNIGGHSLGIFGLEMLSDFVCRIGVGQDRICAQREPPCDFRSGLARGRARRSLCPTKTALRPWSAGGRAPLALEGTALT